MVTVLPMPDIEAVCRRALAAEGVKAYASLPKEPDYPVATVVRLGGVPAVRQKLDRARIQIDTWANSKADARDLADEARQIIYALEGEVSEADDALVTGVEDEMGLTYLQDPDNQKDRYTFTLLVYAHWHVTTS